MEKFALTLQSAQTLQDYIANSCLMKYEKEVAQEILSAIEMSNTAQITWFAGFGDDLRQLIRNVVEYRKGLEFGFTEIAFGQYGWFARPQFLDFEKIKLEASSICLGHGPNGLWAYAISCNYGCAGHSGPLGVHCNRYKSRGEALTLALDELKKDMLGKVGDTDRTNYHQDVISKTLKSITKMEIGLVQLTLF